MERKLYLECYAGISGDMFVASLIDLGVEPQYLIDELKKLNLKGYEIKIGRTKKMTLDACDFDVILEMDNHDHDMKYLHGKDEHTPKNTHAHSHNHAHHHEHHHEHRHLKDIQTIIESSTISDNAKQISLKIFDIIATAEAKSHGVDKESVHFHEVGAVDSIVDIVASGICLDKLQISEVICSSLSEGKGTVRCQHGKIPIPVPAVTNIAIEHGLKLHLTDVQGELITPTGAGIIAAIKTQDSLPDTFTIEKIGIGAGKRQYDIPNVLRAMIIK